MNQNNLLGLVVPPEINTVLTNFASEEQLGESLANITLVDSHYDSSSRMVTVTFEVTNPLKFDLAVNSLSADVLCAKHGVSLGHGGINNPVDLGAGLSANYE